MSILTKFISDPNQKILKRLQVYVDEINDLESEFEALSPEALEGKTEELKGRLAAGETLDSLIEEAFAALREPAK